VSNYPAEDGEELVRVSWCGSREGSRISSLKWRASERERVRVISLEKRWKSKESEEVGGGAREQDDVKKTGCSSGGQT
jgi:hypothetical protein